MDKVFAYCERGLDPAFWAEPLNAVSNAAFILAAVVALMEWQRYRHDMGGIARRSGTELALVALVAVIGTGSFLFHTFATRWAMLADVIPISVFMVVYLGYALRRFAGLGWPLTLAGLGLFFLALRFAESFDCGPRPCLNGSVGYLPALAALALIGMWIAVRGHPAARSILAGSALFAVSLTFRTLDREICATTALIDRPLGTHFIWHMCNATLLYLLLVAAIRHSKHRAQFALVLHRASRARARLLLHGLYASGGSPTPSHRRESRLPRRDGRTNLARLEPGALSSGTASCPRTSRRTRPLFS